MPTNARSHVPFPIEFELYSQLEIKTAFAKDGSPNAPIGPKSGDVTSLPGEPTIDLLSSDITSYIVREISTPNLNLLGSKLWLAGTKRSDNISALHQQSIQGRNIAIAERPELHCTCIYDRIFLKPIPEYLLSWAFWKHFLVNPSSAFSRDERNEMWAASAGFLRSYHHLIQHPSDFRLAQSLHLVPPDITYERCRLFLACFRNIPDEAVSARYQFGELSLRRVNFWGQIFQREFTAQKVDAHYTYDMLFNRFCLSLLVMFAFLRTYLTLSRIVLTHRLVKVDRIPDIYTLVSWFFVFFTVMTLALICLFLILFVTFYVFLLGRRLLFLFRMRWKHLVKVSSGSKIYAAAEH